jgi:hypothetical protein
MKVKKSEFMAICEAYFDSEIKCTQESLNGIMATQYAVMKDARTNLKNLINAVEKARQEQCFKG